MKTRSLKFGEAVKTLASEAGMQIYKFTKYDKEREEKYEKYKKIIKEYKEHFQKQLYDKKFICVKLLKGKENFLMKPFKNLSWDMCLITTFLMNLEKSIL